MRVQLSGTGRLYRLDPVSGEVIGAPLETGGCTLEFDLLPGQEQPVAGQYGYLKANLFRFNEGESMTQPRDVDLVDWLDGVRHHPPLNDATITGHDFARHIIANAGALLHGLLPPGREKSLAFTALEDVLMRANRALAIQGGPAVQDEGYVEWMRQVIADSEIQLDPVPGTPLDDAGADEPIELIPVGDELVFADSDANGREITLSFRPGRVLLQVDESGEDRVGLPFHTANDLEEFAAHCLSARNGAWPNQPHATVSHLH